MNEKTELTNLQILQFVKKATTKQQTELAGSESFHFTEGSVSAYNNIIGIVGKIDIPINGSVNANNLYQLLSKLPEDTSITDKDNSIELKYGRSKASIQKEENSLKKYLDMVFPHKYNKVDVPSDFLEGLAISNFQNYANNLSGVFIDDDTYYAIDSADIASYKTSNNFSETFWIPKDGVSLLLNMPEGIQEYSISSSFLYVFTDNFTVAIKLKISEQFPLKQVTNFLNQYDDFSHTITVPYAIKDTLDRIKLATMKDSHDKYIFKLTTGKELVVESVTSSMHMSIKEELEYTKKDVEAMSLVVPIDNFINLLNSNTLHIVSYKNSIALAVHTEKYTHVLRVSKE